MSKPLIIASSNSLDGAVSALRRGSVVAYPTETFYALAVDPFNKEAVRGLFALKRRSFNKPVGLIIGDLSMLSTVVADVSALADRLMDRFWPGPLTIIFNARDTLPGQLTGGSGTIGVRLPACAVARRLSTGFGSPITATSANPSGQKSPVSHIGILDYFDDGIDCIINGGGLSLSSKGSSVVSPLAGKIEIIREGDIPADLIHSA